MNGTECCQIQNILETRIYTLGKTRIALRVMSLSQLEKIDY
jgi:hypothetical protein